MAKRILAGFLAAALIACLGVASAPVVSPGVEKVSQTVVLKEIDGVGFAAIVEIGDPDGDGAIDAYELLGLKWNLSKYPGGVPYIVNPSTAVSKYGLTQDAVVAEIKAGLESWDSVVTPELYNDTVTINNKAKASTYRPDYKNVITWGSLPTGTVARATIWYYTATKEIVDADIVLNSSYKWGIDPDNEGELTLPAKTFDIQNIATHETGHWTGLKDLYNAAYWAMTMYGYTSYGEVIKISLEPGDIAGAQAVYGG